MRTPVKNTTISFLGIFVSGTLFIFVMTIGGVYFTKQMVIKPSYKKAPSPLFYTSIGHINPRSQKLPTGNYTVQLGIKKSQTEAERFIKELHAQGVQAFYTPQVLEDRLVYLIRTGWYGSRDDADQTIATLPPSVNGEVTILE